MNRIRIGLLITMMLAAIYACSGLFTSLREFGIGLAVFAAAMLLHGLVVYVHDDQITAERAQVWQRRDI